MMLRVLLANMMIFAVSAQCNVTLFKHNELNGRSVFLQPGKYNKFGRMGDNSVSSLKVSEGCSVTLFENKDFSGRAVEFPPGVYPGPGSVPGDAMGAMGVPNDWVSSAIVSYKPLATFEEKCKARLIIYHYENLGKDWGRNKDCQYRGCKHWTWCTRYYGLYWGYVQNGECAPDVNRGRFKPFEREFRNRFGWIKCDAGDVPPYKSARAAADEDVAQDGTEVQVPDDAIVSGGQHAFTVLFSVVLFPVVILQLLIL
jgi:hypothetical protein